MNAPHMSAERMRELNRQGLAAKRGRAEIRRQLKARTLAVSDLILNPPPLALERMEVGDVLRMLPQVKDYRASRILGEADVRHTRPFGNLTPRERHALVSTIEEHHPYLVRTA